MNPSLSPNTIATVALSALLVVLVIVWQVRAARSGLAAFAKVHVAKALLAAVYLAAYLVLLFTDVMQGAWSRWLMPAGLAAWVIAWGIDAEVSLRERRRQSRQVEAVLGDSEVGGDGCGDH